jgi:hypothetical protein
MDETEVHSTLRERCSSVLAEGGWRQLAVAVESPDEVGQAFTRDPSITGLKPEILMVLIATRASDRLWRARSEIQCDPQFVGVITVLGEPVPDLVTHALRIDQLLTEQGRTRMLEMAEDLEAWASVRGAPR